MLTVARIFVSIILFLSTQCFAQKVLILGVHPYLDESEINDRFTPLVAYLERAINKPIKLKIASNYRQHIDYIGKNNVDLAYMGPSSYVKMVKLHGLKPLLARLEVNGKPYFKGKAFVLKNSNIKNLLDLPGKDIAFGSKESTMGSVLPRWTLQNEGIHLSQFNSFQYLSNHTNVAYSVLMGDFDAGFTKEEIFYSFKNRGLREIGSTTSISEHLFVANNYLPKKLIMQIKKALYELGRDEAGKKILRNIKHNLTNMVPVTDSNYNSLRNIESQLNESSAF